MAPRSPTVSRRRLAAELRRLRGYRTGGTVAKALGWSPAKISRYELGRTSYPLDEVEKLLDFYGVTQSRRAQLVALAEGANQRGWWEEYADAIAPEYMEFIGLEAEAVSVAHWEVGVVAGLLQTEEYARNIYNGFQAVFPTAPTTIERRVRVRMLRQQVLTSRDPPLELSVVLDEGALLRKIGDAEVMYRQLRHLAEIGDLPNVQLQVLSLESAGSLIAGSFVVFGLSAEDETGKLGDVVSTEGLTDNLQVEGETDTFYIYRLFFKKLVELALSPDDSRRLILRTAAQRWA